MDKKGRGHLCRLLVAFMLTAFLLLPSVAFATATGQEPGTAQDETSFILDPAGLLTEGEREGLNRTLTAIHLERNFDVVIAAVRSLDGSEGRELAAEYYDAYNFGTNSTRDGVILLIATEGRDYGIASHGLGQNIFDEEAQTFVMDQILPLLKEDMWFDSFSSFINTADDFVLRYQAGLPYSETNPPVGYRFGSSAYGLGGGSEGSLVRVLIALLLAALLAAGVVVFWATRLKTARRQRGATNYVRDGSFGVTRSRDIFLFRNLTMTARPKPQSSGGGGGHFTSSSGGSFTGKSGKF
ncbi:MAG: TPM domain-containing protein [Clostridiales Family XIII bacterium]|jgi:uncharacterized protein|nr:TPM domain-containing protein [Clostridiales Family XIII bacterium]